MCFPYESGCMDCCFRGRDFSRSVSSPSAARSITMCLPKLTVYAAPASSRMMKPSSWRAFSAENTFSSWKISCRRLTTSVWDCGLPSDNSTISGRFTLKILQSRSRSVSVAGWNISMNRMRLFRSMAFAMNGLNDRVCPSKWMTPFLILGTLFPQFLENLALCDFRILFQKVCLR